MNLKGEEVVIAGDFIYEDIYKTFKDRDEKFNNDQLIRLEAEKLTAFNIKADAERNMISAESKENQEKVKLLKQNYKTKKEVNDKEVQFEREENRKIIELEKIRTNKKIFDKGEDLKLGLDSIEKQKKLNNKELDLNQSKQALLMSDNELSKLDADGKKAVREIEIAIEGLQRGVGSYYEIAKLDKILNKLPELIKDDKTIQQLRIFQVQNGNSNSEKPEGNILNPTYNVANAIQLLKNLLNFLKE